MNVKGVDSVGGGGDKKGYLERKRFSLLHVYV
jgi:hypothetical protein